jgi:DNA-directed RNA polymerase specialized sigma24 family protein
MSPRDKEILSLRHKDNLSRKEIAARLNVPMVTIHARFERAYARLRETLSRHFTTMAFTPFAPVPLKDILQLRPAFREAVTARHLDELPEAAAAAKLGIPAATLRARLESAYQMLGCGPGADFSGAREERRRTP